MNIALSVFGLISFLLYLVQAIRLWRGQAPSQEVRSGRCLPLYDKVTAVIQLIFALLYLAMAVCCAIYGFSVRVTVTTLPNYLMILLFIVIPVLALLAHSIALALLREDILY